jgi:hypothetical protein
MQFIFICFNQFFALLILIINDLSDFSIYHLTGPLTEGLLVSLRVRVVNRAEALHHAVLADNALGYLGALLDVVRGSGRYFTEEDLLSDSATESDRYHVAKLLLGV